MLHNFPPSKWLDIIVNCISTIHATLLSLAFIPIHLYTFKTINLLDEMNQEVGSGGTFIKSSYP